MADGMTQHASRTAGDYHSVHLTEDPARAVVWRAVAEHLSSWIAPDARVLEIGAGYCCWINAVRAGRKVAVDSWPGFAAHAAPDVQAIVMDAAASLRSLGDGLFDAILASNFLEHFEPAVVDALVGDVAALLRPGGRFLIVQPNFRYAFRHYFDDYTHRSVFTDVSLPNLLRARGFTIEAVHPRYLPYSMRGRQFPISSWLVRLYLMSPIKPFAGQMLVVGRWG
jgi:cyclopropane fatty-acyl-phospholipid synthase-like methyltransferase